MLLIGWDKKRSIEILTKKTLPRWSVSPFNFDELVKA